MSQTTTSHQVLSYLNSFRRRVFKSHALETIYEAIREEKLPSSVFFFTTHKCASVFVPKILINIQKNSNRSIRFRDYAREMWSLGQSINLSDGYEPFLERHASLLFRPNGFIYGPQRRPLDFNGLKSFKKIFFLRDPRDVIVSSFYSFGGSHSLPLNPTERDRILSQKNYISNLTIDDYALEYSLPRVKKTYNDYINLIKSTSSDKIFFCTYDQFITDPCSFIMNIATFCGVDNKKMILSASKLAKLASPVRNKINQSSHKRDGSSNQFISNLEQSTVNVLNAELHTILNFFNFN